MNPYTIAGYTIYWKFPTGAERAGVATLFVEIGKIALQEDNFTLWMLTDNVPTWRPIGQNIPTISNDTDLIPANFQRIIYEEYEINGQLDIVGQLVIL